LAGPGTAGRSLPSVGGATEGNYSALLEFDGGATATLIYDGYGWQIAFQAKVFDERSGFLKHFSS